MFFLQNRWCVVCHLLLVNIFQLKCNFSEIDSIAFDPQYNFCVVCYSLFYFCYWWNAPFNAFTWISLLTLILKQPKHSRQTRCIYAHHTEKYRMCFCKIVITAMRRRSYDAKKIHLHTMDICFCVFPFFLLCVSVLIFILLNRSDVQYDGLFSIWNSFIFSI